MENAIEGRPWLQRLLAVLGSIVLIGALVGVAAASRRSARTDYVRQPASSTAGGQRAALEAVGQPDALYVQGAIEPTFELSTAQAVVEAGGMTSEEWASASGGVIFSVADSGGHVSPMFIVLWPDGHYRTFLVDIVMQPFSARYLYEYAGALQVWRNGQWNQIR